MKPTKQTILHKNKYEFLLAALFLHLFTATFMTNLTFYAKVLWPLNMVLLGIFSIGIFSDRGKIHLILKNILLLLVIALPIIISFVEPTLTYMSILSGIYITFFGVLFVAVLQFLIRPSYISTDVISASICGYLLLIEIGVFTMQLIYAGIPNAFKGLDTSTFTTTYLDIVYFCTITLTSIGFGDITPAHHISKLATAVLGIVGQFYSVVLVGILISKYSSSTQ
ncbi:ion channel [Spirosoma sp. SC4-14]|uniref:ion channel n=1 Tax=Spirosoma sp. SC4-14 TaxID=3128900 RepID=UPI0030D2C352